MLATCTAPGCCTLTIGGLCVAHEPVHRPEVFPRGRPFPAPFGVRTGRQVVLVTTGKELVADVVLMEGVP